MDNLLDKVLKLTGQFINTEDEKMKIFKLC